MRLAACGAALLLAACLRPSEPPAEARLLASGQGLHGFSVSSDGSRAAWVEGRWPDRTELVQLEPSSSRSSRARLKGYTLIAARLEDGALRVDAHALGFSENPNASPKPDVVLTVDREGIVLSTAPYDGRPAPARSPDGARWSVRLAEEGQGWLLEGFEGSGRRLIAAELPAPVETLLAERDALYLVLLSSESLSGAAKGPRELRKLDRDGRLVWSAPWAPRPGRLLARSAEGRLYASVEDGGGATLWAFPDDPKAAAAVGAAAWDPRAGRARTLRTAGLYLARFLPAILLAVLFFSFRH